MDGGGQFQTSAIICMHSFFVIFDVEVIFIYPWAVRFNKLGIFALGEMMVFIMILLVGWLYAWRKQDLEWR